MCDGKCFVAAPKGKGRVLITEPQEEEPQEEGEVFKIQKSVPIFSPRTCTGSEKLISPLGTIKQVSSLKINYDQNYVKKNIFKFKSRSSHQVYVYIFFKRGRCLIQKANFCEKHFLWVLARLPRGNDFFFGTSALCICKVEPIKLANLKPAVVSFQNRLEQLRPTDVPSRLPGPLDPPC